MISIFCRLRAANSAKAFDRLLINFVSKEKVRREFTMNMIQNAKDAGAGADPAGLSTRPPPPACCPPAVPCSPRWRSPRTPPTATTPPPSAWPPPRRCGRTPGRWPSSCWTTWTCTGSYFTSAEIAGPGFLNFRLGHALVRRDRARRAVRRAKPTAKTTRLQGKKYMVEFVSANPTGPMHMGNARGGVLGDTLASVLAEVRRRRMAGVLCQ